MPEANEPVSVSILDKEYRFASPASERDALIEAARYLDTKMREVRDAGRVIGLDRVAVMTALNVTHELLQQRNRPSAAAEGVSERLDSLSGQIDTVLARDAERVAAAEGEAETESSIESRV